MDSGENSIGVIEINKAVFYAALFRFREKWQYLDKEDARIVGVRSTEQSVWHLLPPQHHKGNR